MEAWEAYEEIKNLPNCLDFLNYLDELIWFYKLFIIYDCYISRHLGN